MADIKVIKSKKLSSQFDERFVVVDANTEEVLDNAQGYGYKSIQKAYAAWNYKHRDKAKQAEKKKKEHEIKAWMKNHKDFVKLMDTCAFEIMKGSWGPDDKFDAKLVKQMLKDNNLDVEFTPGELLRVWRKM